MDGTNAAFFFQDLKYFPNMPVGDLASTPRWRYVGGEDLDGGITFLNDLADLGQNFRWDRPLQHDVVAVVGVTIPTPILFSDVDDFFQGATLLPVGKIQQCGGAAVNGGLADHVRAVSPAHFSSLLQRRDVPQGMDVRVDAAWYDDLARGVDHLTRLAAIESAWRRDGGDGFARNANIPSACTLRCDDLVSTNNQIKHLYPPQFLF